MRPLLVVPVALVALAAGSASAGGPPAPGKPCARVGAKASTKAGKPLVCKRNRGRKIWVAAKAAPVQPPAPQPPAPPAQPPPPPPSTGLTQGPLEPLPGKPAPSLAPGVGLIADAGHRAIRLSTGVPQGLDVDPATGRVYVGLSSAIGNWCGHTFTGARDNRLAVVDPAAGAEIASVAAGGSPIWPRVASGVVWLAESSGTLGYHDPGDGRRVGAVQVGGLPHDVAVDERTGFVFVSNTADGSQQKMTVVRAGDKTVAGTHTVERFPHRIVLDSAKGRAWMVGVETGALTVIDTATGAPVGRVESGGGAGLAYSPAQGRLFVSAREGNGEPHSVKVVDAASGAAVGTIGPFVQGWGKPAGHMAVDDEHGLLFVVIGETRYVGVADLRTLKPLAVFAAAECPFGVALDVRRGLGFVTGTNEAALSVFDLRRVLAALGR